MPAGTAPPVRPSGRPPLRAAGHETRAPRHCARPGPRAVSLATRLAPTPRLRGSQHADRRRSPAGVPHLESDRHGARVTPPVHDHRRLDHVVRGGARDHAAGTERRTTVGASCRRAVPCRHGRTLLEVPVHVLGDPPCDAVDFACAAEDLDHAERQCPRGLSWIRERGDQRLDVQGHRRLALRRLGRPVGFPGDEVECRLGDGLRPVLPLVVPLYCSSRHPGPFRSGRAYFPCDMQNVCSGRAVDNADLSTQGGT